jgi:hypothetical protein
MCLEIEHVYLFCFTTHFLTTMNLFDGSAKGDGREPRELRESHNPIAKSKWYDFALPKAMDSSPREEWLPCRFAVAATMTQMATPRQRNNMFPSVVH